MTWIDVTTPDAGGWRKCRCEHCGYIATSPYPHANIFCICHAVDQRPPAPFFGPGAELTKLAKEFAPNGCQTGLCLDRAKQMNRWGVAGCDENRDTIIGWLKDSASRQNWLDAAKSGAILLTKLWFDPLRPIESILDEALRLAAVQPITQLQNHSPPSPAEPA